MSWDANKERCQKIYFGEPLGLKPTRHEVGEFIMDEMGMVYDDGPAWSEGVPQLVEMGMRCATHQFHGESLESFDEVRYERDRLQRENAELRKQLSNRRKQVKPEQAVDCLKQIEASILSVLCLEENHSDDGLEFVEVPTIVQDSGLEYSTVVNYLEKLTRTEFGGYVGFDETNNKARAKDESAFERYCKMTRLDPQSIA